MPRIKYDDKTVKVKGRVIDRSKIKGYGQSEGMTEKTKTIKTKAGEVITQKTTKYDKGVSKKNLKEKTQLIGKNISPVSLSKKDKTVTVKTYKKNN